VPYCPTKADNSQKAHLSFGYCLYVSQACVIMSHFKHRNDNLYRYASDISSEYYGHVNDRLSSWHTITAKRIETHLITFRDEGKDESIVMMIVMMMMMMMMMLITKYQSKMSGLVRARRNSTHMISDSGEHKRCPESSSCLSRTLRRGQTQPALSRQKRQWVT